MLPVFERTPERWCVAWQPTRSLPRQGSTLIVTSRVWELPTAGNGLSMRCAPQFERVSCFIHAVPRQRGPRTSSRVPVDTAGFLRCAPQSTQPPITTSTHSRTANDATPQARSFTGIADGETTELLAKECVFAVISSARVRSGGGSSCPARHRDIRAQNRLSGACRAPRDAAGAAYRKTQPK